MLNSHSISKKSHLRNCTPFNNQSSSHRSPIVNRATNHSIATHSDLHTDTSSNDFHIKINNNGAAFLHIVYLFCAVFSFIERQQFLCER